MHYKDHYRSRLRGFEYARRWLFEKVYERALIVELATRGLRASAQPPISIYYKGNLVGQYSPDIVVEGL